MYACSLLVQERQQVLCLDVMHETPNEKAAQADTQETWRPRVRVCEQRMGTRKTSFMQWSLGYVDDGRMTRADDGCAGF